MLLKVFKKRFQNETENGSTEDPQLCTKLDQVKQPLFQNFHL